VKENVIKDNIYGPKFRKMRVAHHINLVDAAKGITNKSTLAEWEKGKDSLSWCKVIALFFNIHVQPMEFLENTVSSHLYFSIQDIADAYGANNIKQLKSNFVAVFKAVSG
jgi:DNA-binding XRE family transcriptional regulator